MIETSPGLHTRLVWRVVAGRWQPGRDAAQPVSMVLGGPGPMRVYPTDPEQRPLFAAMYEGRSRR